MPLTISVLADRPDLVEPMWDMPNSWPEFMRHDPIGGLFYGNVETRFAEYVLIAQDDAGEVVGCAYSIPFVCDHEDALPDNGWDFVIRNGLLAHLHGDEPDAISAVEIAVRPDRQGTGLSGQLLAAMRDNAARMEKVLARLGQLGIARRDVQTSGISLNAQYRYTNDNVPPAFLGYDATNQVSVILRDIDKVGPTLDALVTAGANNVNGPFFGREDDKAQRAAAREAAFRSGEAQAREYARMAGFAGVRLLSVEETLQRGGPIAFDVANQAAVGVTAVKSTPIEPGRVGTTIVLTAKYEMTR